jgi:uncharacterized protein involved in outer membrane biogenesis
MKKAGLAVLVLLALGALAVYLVFNYVDVIVKATLEHWGPDVTGVAIHVGEVRISPRDGRGEIRALEIGNPAGFTAPRAARLGEIRVAIDPATLTSPVILVRELAVESPQITYEKGPKGTNLDAIQSHIEAYVSSASAAESSSGGAGRVAVKRRFIIDSLTIRGGHVLMTNPGLRGQGLNFDLPDIQLRDIGKRQGGVTASEVAALVASTLQVKIAQKLLTNLDLLRKGGVEGAVDALKGLLK